MNKIKFFLGAACTVIAVAAVAATTVKQQQFDYYQKGTVCVQIPDTNCSLTGTPCQYLDPATGVNYRIYDIRPNASTCQTPLSLQ
jgi:hypothetical protein